MQRAKVALQNFQFGEISPLAIARTDSEVYNNSAQRLENLFLLAEGGVLKRSGTKHIYTYDTTLNKTACTITVTDYANIAVGSQVVLTTSSGTEVRFTSETAGSSSASDAQGWRPNTNNNTTADNLYTAINNHSLFTVSNPSANVITVTETSPDPSGLLTITSTDATRLAVVSEARNRTQHVRIIPFIFSDDERYIVSLENAKIRVFSISTTDAVSLVQTITADTSGDAVPFADSIIHQISYANSGDTMFLAHQSFMIRKIVRTSLTAFQLETFTFATNEDSSLTFQPYGQFNPSGITIDPNESDAGSANITASADYFTSDHVGTRLRYHLSEILITSFTNAQLVGGTIATGGLKQQLDINALRTIEGSASIEITHAQHGMRVGDNIAITEAAAIAGIASGNINGTRTITAIIDSNRYRFNAASGTANASIDGGGAPKITTHGATTEFFEQSYSPVRGYPACVAFHEGRLWFGGTTSQPDTIWGSKSNDFFNFDVGTAGDDDSIELTASIGEINTIRHIVSNRDLQIFTSTSEFYIPAFSNAPITPTNAQIRRQTPYGANFVRPHILNGATVYCQASGKAISQYVFTDRQAAYVSQNISTLSSHLIKTPHQMAILQGALDRPETYLFLVNSDGTIGVYNSNPSEQKAGWTEFTTNGIFESICVVDTSVYVTAWYDTGAGTRTLYLMRFDSSKNLDLSRDYVTSSASTVTGVSSDYVNGAKLDVISESAYVGNFTMASSKIVTSTIQALDINRKVEVGFSFPVELKTNPIDIQLSNGPLTGEPRSLSRVIVDMNTTGSMSVNGSTFIIRNTTDDFSTGNKTFTGKKEFRLLGYSTNPQVTVTQDAPLSMQLNGLIAEVSF
mgnify:FL=1|tara:strand:+ start:8991 stop:11567 length:2577 start_codon:yes stop_codon:yes gene_type:complete